MEIKHEELTRIDECGSERLEIKDCHFCMEVSKASLENSTFNNVNLSGAVFDKTDLRAAYFNRAGLANSQFKSVNFVRAVFEESGMPGVMFKGVDMERSDFDGAGLSKSIITNCDLRDAHVQLTGNVGRGHHDGEGLGICLAVGP